MTITTMQTRTASGRRAGVGSPLAVPAAAVRGGVLPRPVGVPSRPPVVHPGRDPDGRPRSNTYGEGRGYVPGLADKRRHRLVGRRQDLTFGLQTRSGRLRARALAVAQSPGALLVGLAGIVLAVGISPAVGDAPQADGPVATSSVTVAPGETLADIARDVAPGQPEGDVMARIASMNGLGSTAPGEGAVLSVPVYR
ncbi:LysM peptidoglycan-binding domain-containing protein [Corynebacterium bovis]|uniref:LysM peptidoglycan-binding domain-containing protein n=1 Tax=Corynebacterium bovis TaxID=36808 RepID=UPI00254A2548|nr:LysM peptidoglycan-binding domain-containing protein [Corynebacterium bovis]MDK8510616.1 LysM peptidoglycan-binding domain-containing protein [Corynebacterium bovis]